MTRFTHQPILGGKRLRQKFFGLAFGVFFLIGFISLSEAGIRYS